MNESLLWLGSWGLYGIFIILGFLILFKTLESLASTADMRKNFRRTDIIDEMQREWEK